MNRGGAIKIYGLVLILVLSMLVTVVPPGMFSDGFQASENDSASVSGFKAANGFWEQRTDYDWSVSKTVSEEYLAVPVGDSAVLQYSIAVDKELNSVTDVFGVFGGIYVINSGDSPTVGLSITDTVLYSLDGGSSWMEIVSESVDTSDKPVLQGDSDFFNYPYLINFEPVEGASYLNRATVTIDNGDGYVAEMRFSLPDAPLMLSVSDGEAEVTDLFDVPAGWSISVGDEGPWQMSESGVITFDVTVTNDMAAPGSKIDLNNSAMVTEMDTGRISDDQATVILESLGNACINVTKTGPECAWEGKTVTYTITVTNCGDVDLVAITVFDQAIDFYAELTKLAAGESYTWEVDFVIPPLSECEEYFCNQVTVVGWHKVNCQPTYQVIDHAFWCIKIWHPGMEIEKWTDHDMLPEGHPVTYFYEITNTGDSPMNDVRVFDDKLGWFYLDDHEADGTLLSGESWSFSVASSIPVTDQMDIWFLNNVATVYGDICDGTWEASTEWNVEVVRPDITVTKWSSYEVITPGHMIPFYINVTNTGNIDLNGVYVNDSLMGTFYKASDTDDGVLAPGETWEMVLWYELGEDDGVPWSLCNDVTAYGFVCHAWISDDARWCIGIVHPSIDIVKTVDSACDMFLEGQTVTYTINVTNTGDVALENVRVFDTMLGWSYLDGDGMLAAGESWVFTYDHALPMTDADEQYQICNEATAYGDICHATVSDMDSVCLTVVHPSIDIEKTADRDTAYEGETVNYTLSVTNTGDVDLKDVRVFDTMLGWFYLDGDGILSPGEIWVIEYDYLIPETGNMDQYVISNLATAYGTVCDEDVTDADDFDLTIEEESYYSATQGYWQNHPDAWVGISPDDQFPWVDDSAYPDGLTYMQVLQLSAAGGDASVILAHQYIAAKLNDNMWGAPSEFADYLAQAEDLLEDFPVGSDPQGDDREEAIYLSEILDSYNNGGIEP